MSFGQTTCKKLLDEAGVPSFVTIDGETTNEIEHRLKWFLNQQSKRQTYTEVNTVPNSASFGTDFHYTMQHEFVD